MNKEQDEELQKISDTFQKMQEDFEKKNDDWWDNLSMEEKEHAFYAVVKRIHQGDMVDKGSYRYVLYDVFGFDFGMYVQGMNCGYMDIHNAIIVDLNGDDENDK